MQRQQWWSSGSLLGPQRKLVIGSGDLAGGRGDHGRAGHGLPLGPCSPDNWSAQAAVNTSRCPPANSAITSLSRSALASSSEAISCGYWRARPAASSASKTVG